MCVPQVQAKLPTENKLSTTELKIKQIYTKKL